MTPGSRRSVSVTALSQYDIYAVDLSRTGSALSKCSRERGLNKGVCIAVLPTFVNYSLRDDGTAI